MNITTNIDTATDPALPAGRHRSGQPHRFFQPKRLFSGLSASYLDKRTLQNAKGDIWVKCGRCGELNYVRQFEVNAKVCFKCRHHARLSGGERLASLLDKGSFVEINQDLETADPLSFETATGSYAVKTLAMRHKLGSSEALITGYGTLGGRPLAVAVADFAFMGASMGSVFGEKLVRLIEFAIEHRLAVLTVSSSGGARMHEGLFSLMQMAKTTAALVQLGKQRLPHISLLVDPCYGGVTASYAMVADVILAEPGARIGFAGPRVIEQITRQSLPAEFQTAEFLFEHGMLDGVVERYAIRGMLGELLELLEVPPPLALAIGKDLTGNPSPTEQEQPKTKLLFRVA